MPCGRGLPAVFQSALEGGKASILGLAQCIISPEMLKKTLLLGKKGTGFLLGQVSSVLKASPILKVTGSIPKDKFQAD